MKLLLLLLLAGMALAQNPVERIITCTTTGSADAYVCTPTPALGAYATGNKIRLTTNFANTGAATVNVSALGTKSLVKTAGGITTALAANDLRSGQVAEFVYDGTNFQMVSTLGNAAAGGGGGAGLSSTAPIVEEFLGGYAGSYYIGALGWSAGGAASFAYGGLYQALHPGIWTTTTGATSGNTAYTYLLPSALPALTAMGAVTFDMGGVGAPITDPANSNIVMGLVQESAVANPLGGHFFGITYDTAASDATYQVIGCNAGSCSAKFNTGITPAANTFLSWRVYSTTAGTALVSFTTDGNTWSAPKSFCTSGCDYDVTFSNSTSISWTPIFYIRTRTTAAKTIACDKWVFIPPSLGW